MYQNSCQLLFLITNDAVTGRGELFMIVSYSGAEYEGAVRQLDVTPTKKAKRH